MNDLQWLSAQKSLHKDLLIPRHVAMIMDGNGRYARRCMRSRGWGHRLGAQALKRAVQAAHVLEIPYLTLYAFSLENWGRPAEEVKILMDLLLQYLVEQRQELQRRSIRLHIIGNTSLLPFKVRDELEKTCELLKDNHHMHLTLALSYSGREELTSAMQALAREVEAGVLEPEDITSEMISGALGTAGMPDPDLLIRTSGEMRLSNFLLWQLAYTEFYFASVCWPEFRASVLWKAILSYNERRRSFGLTLPEASSLPVVDSSLSSAKKAHPSL